MPRRRALVAALVGSAVAAAAWADGGGVEATATLHLRATATDDLPSTDVRYDVASRTFALDRYLVPAGSASWGSALASFAVEGRHLAGRLRWALAVDTGELRRERLPLLAPVCRARPGETPIGLDVVGSGTCALAGAALYPLEETRDGDLELLSNGRPIEDEVEATALVREAWIAAAFGPAGFAVVRAGRRRTVVADGLVHDDYATGVDLALDLGALGPPLDVSLAVFEPTRDFLHAELGQSPMVALRVDWLPSLFEHAGLFLAAYRDRGGNVAETAREAVVERLAIAVQEAQAAGPGTVPAERAGRLLAASLSASYEGEATLVWAGTSGSLSPWRGARLGWTGALLGGRIDSIVAPQAGTLAEDVALSGEALSLRLDADVGRRLEAGVFVVHLSGGTMPIGQLGAGGAVPATGGYGGFLGVTPYVTATNLFFGGGLSETFAARQATAPGVNGRGVTAPGARLAWDPADALSLEAKLAWLRADVAGPGGGDVYGTELDLVLTWAPREWLLLGAELDTLWPGDFFAGRETVHKAVLAMDLVTP